MAMIDSAYTYYLTAYGNRPGTRYDSHKKSELQNVYQKMMAVNKDAPLYILNHESEVTRFAIDIKEGAQHIRHVVASISGSDDIMKALQKKSAASSKEDVVTARYVGNPAGMEDLSDFEIEVKALATPQINTGAFLKSSQRDLPVDSYSFDLETSDSGYEFQFHVNPEDTNYTIQNKLAGLITNANIGLAASVVETEAGLSALKIQSLYTGLQEGEEFSFRILAGDNASSAGALDILGIDHVSQEAGNAAFLLNGNEHTSYSNIFSINDTFELQLLRANGGEGPAIIGMKPNTQAMIENIQGLTEAYNSVMKTAQHYAQTQNQGHKLQYQLGSAAGRYLKELSAIGLDREESGLLSVDVEKLSGIIESEQPSEQLSVLNDFKRALDEKAAMAMLNPIDYVNKTIVAYKNPGRSFPSPYVSSLYSGMLMDWRC